MLLLPVGLLSSPLAAATGLLLDNFPVAIRGAFSFRRTRTDYIGPCIRVRRSSDNAEQDIGFTSGNLLDTTALAGFCGSASGYMSKWCNQDGSGRDIYNTVASSQPILVDAGTLQTVNGVPVLHVHPDAGRGTYTIPAGVFGGLASSSMVVAFGQADANTSWGQVGSSGQLNHTPYGDGNAYDSYLATSRGAFGPYGSTPGGATIHAATNTGSALSVFRNGAQVGGAQALGFTNTPASAGDDGYFGNSLLGEMVFAAAALTNAQRLTLERGMGAYFGVTTA